MTAGIKPRKNYGISRIDQPEKKNHGWYVRINGKRKFFADGIYSGKRRSWEAAENYRDIQFDGLPARLQQRAAKPRPRKNARK